MIYQLNLFVKIQYMWGGGERDIDTIVIKPIILCINKMTYLYHHLDRSMGISITEIYQV